MEKNRVALQKIIAQKGYKLELNDINPFIKNSDPLCHSLFIRAIGITRKKTYFSAIVPFANSSSVLVKNSFAYVCGLLQDKRAIPFLTKLVQESCSLVSWEATVALARIQSKNTSQIIAEMLSSSNSIVRMECVRMLGKVNSLEHLSKINSLMGDSSKIVKLTTLETISKVSNSLSRSITENYLHHNDSDIKISAIYALRSFLQRTHLSTLGKLTQDQNEEVRGQSVVALGELGLTEAIPYLLVSYKDRSNKVRAAAIRALGGVATYSELNFIIRALNDRYYKVRIEAALALGKLGYVEAAKALVSKLNDWNKEVKRAVALSLCSLDEKVQLNEESLDKDSVLEILSDVDIKKKRSIFFKFKLQEEKDFQYISLFLEETDIEIRRQAAHLLFNIKSEAAYSLLSNCLYDKSSIIQWETLYNMLGYDSTKIHNGILHIFRKKTDPFFQIKALQNLPLETVVSLLPEIKNKIITAPSILKLSIVFILSYSNSEKIIPLLRQVMLQGEPYVQEAAATKLVEFKDPEAIKILNSLYTNKTPSEYIKVLLAPHNKTKNNTQNKNSEIIDVVQLRDNLKSNLLKNRLDALTVIQAKRIYALENSVLQQSNTEKTILIKKALDTLVILKSKKIPFFLLKLLNKSNPEIIFLALTTIATTRNPTYYQILQQLSKHTYKPIRRLAQQITRNIEGSRWKRLFNPFN